MFIVNNPLPQPITSAFSSWIATIKGISWSNESSEYLSATEAASFIAASNCSFFPGKRPNFHCLPIDEKVL
jgi:hypothetical protein